MLAKSDSHDAFNKDGEDAAPSDGDAAAATMAAVVEKAVDAADGAEARDAMEEKDGESAKDICRDVTVVLLVGTRMEGGWYWSVIM